MSQKVNTTGQFSILQMFGAMMTNTLLKTSDICLLVDNKGEILDSTSQTFENVSQWKQKNLRDVLAAESIEKYFHISMYRRKHLTKKKSH